MKVLQLAKLCPPCEGGIDIYSYDLTEELHKMGVDVDIICFSDETKILKKGFKQYSVKITCKVYSALISIDLIKTFLRIRNQYDILHVHIPNPLLEVLTLFFQGKIIIHWHSDVVRQKIVYWIYKPLQNLILKRAHLIICTSPQYRETSKALRPFLDKVVVVPLGINPERICPNEMLNLKHDKIMGEIKNKKMVLSIGRLVTYKGFEYLIEAAKYLSDDIVICIIGDGPLHGKLTQKVKQLGLESKVILLGKVSNVGEYLKLCDVFCLPSISRNEAFGLVLVEALYFGKPLVTTNVEGSGMNYVNIDGITGYIVPPKNPKLLAEAIHKIIQNPNIIREFSTNAKRRFDEFHIKVSAEKVFSLYKKITHEN